MALGLSCALCKVENAGKFYHKFDTILGHFIRMALDWSNNINFFLRGIEAGSTKILSRSQEFGFTTEIDHKPILSFHFLNY